jgi:PAS domain S-box-containing protein
MKFLLYRVFLVLVVFSSTAACQTFHSWKTPPKAVKGILDLQSWDMEKDGPVDLAGEFEFIWKQHVEPSRFSGPPRAESSFIKVPAYWSDLETRDGRLPGRGFATYRLRVMLGDREESLALRFLSMGTAFAVYVNAQKLGAVGVPGVNRETTVPRYFPQVMAMDRRAGHLDVVFHVSNFHHRRGGAWESIQLGKENQLRESRERRVGIDLFLFGSIFIIALYHFGLFFVRRQDRSPLYFALFCATVSVRLLTTGERYLTHILPNLSWELFLKLEYLSISLAVPAFALFMHSLFPREFRRSFLRFIVAASVALSLVVLLTPGSVFSRLLTLCNLLLLATFCFGLFVLVRSIRHKRDGALIFLAGYMILSLAAINDIMHVAKIIQTGFFAAFGLFVFIFSQAVILSLRFSRALSMVEVQHRELTVSNDACRREIVNRMATENALRQSEDKYRTILHSIEDGYYEVDLSGNFSFFNDALCRILGYSREELLGMNNRAYMKEETAEEVYRTFEEVYRTGRPAKVFGWETVRKDGTRRHLEISISLMRDQEGNSVGFRGLARDVTERKEAEERDRLHQQQLIHASKMVELGTLVSGVAHEINNPNNFIMLNTPLLLDAWNAARPILEEYYEDNGDFIMGGMPYSEMKENIPRLFSGINEGSGRIKQIVNDLRDYVRQETSDLNQQVDLNSVVESALSLLSNMVKKSTDRFSVRAGKDLPLIRGNFQRLEQVVINLVQNACQALPDRTKGITMSTRRDSDHVVLCVEDEGAGIAPEDMPRIMDPFFSTKHDSGGVGLGLAISSTIVKQHGGTMHFASQPGKGTKAEVILPVNRDHQTY